MCINLIELEYQNQFLNHIAEHCMLKIFAARLRQYLMIIEWYLVLDLLEDWTYFCCSSQGFITGGTSFWWHPEKRETKSAPSSVLTFSLFNSKAVFIIASSGFTYLYWSRCFCNASFNLTGLVRVTGAYNLASSDFTYLYWSRCFCNASFNLTGLVRVTGAYNLASSDFTYLYWSRCFCNASFNLTGLVRVTGAYNLAGSDFTYLYWSRCFCNASFNLTGLVRVTGAYNLAGWSRFVCQFDTMGMTSWTWVLIK